MTIISILDWCGTIFILLGNYIITTSLASKPKIRLIGISSFLLSNIFWMPFAIILGVEGLLITQILLMPMNIRGIRNCYKELKKLKTIPGVD